MGDLRTLELLLICAGHPQYEVETLQQTHKPAENIKAGLLHADLLEADLNKVLLF